MPPGRSRLARPARGQWGHPHGPPAHSRSDNPDRWRAGAPPRAGPPLYTDGPVQSRRTRAARCTATRERGSAGRISHHGGSTTGRGRAAGRRGAVGPSACTLKSQDGRARTCFGRFRASGDVRGRAVRPQPLHTGARLELDSIATPAIPIHRGTCFLQCEAFFVHAATPCNSVNAEPHTQLAHVCIVSHANGRALSVHALDV